ncbi:hypothetical protein ACE1TF_07100 [Geomicrobium sp. JSM 1781026]
MRNWDVSIKQRIGAPESLKTKTYASALEGISDARKRQRSHAPKRRRKQMIFGLGGGTVLIGALVFTLVTVVPESVRPEYSSTQLPVERPPAEIPANYGLSERPDEREITIEQEGMPSDVRQKLVDDEDLPFSFYLPESIDTDVQDGEEIRADPIHIQIFDGDDTDNFDAYANEIDTPVESYSDNPFENLGGTVIDYQDFERGYAYLIDYDEYTIAITSIAETIEAIEGRLHIEEQLVDSWEWKEATVPN